MNPGAKDAYRRLMVLKYLISRAYRSQATQYIDQNFNQLTDKEKSEIDTDFNKNRDETISSLKGFGLWEYVTPSEKSFFSLSAPEITEEAQINASWRMEAAAVLMWALNLIDCLPDIDMQADTDLLRLVKIRKIGFIYDGPKLRPPGEISQLRNIIETWHWRVNTRRLIESDYDFQPTESMQERGISSLDDIVKMTASRAYENGDINEFIEDDFVFRGQPFRSLTNDDFYEATSIIIERHHALNWLCGYAPKNAWDETPTDT